MILSDIHTSIAMTKAFLLSKSYIRFSSDIKNNIEKQKGNLYRKEWVFIRLNRNSRVRLIYNENADILLIPSQDGTYYIQDIITNSIIIKNVQIEKVLAHAPEQLFFALYKKCSMGCKFCPLSTRIDDAHYSLDLMYSRIKNIKNNEIKSISITSSSPPNLSTSDVVDEMIFLINKIKNIVNPDIPIGVSVKEPSKEDLSRLKENGVNEVRLNLEIFNDSLSQKLMPIKNKKNIMKSIAYACDIFGTGFVSSNMIIGVGENDSDLLLGTEALAKLGAVATLYPYDSIESITEDFHRPTVERLYSLAIEQKKIFDKYKIDTSKLKTMCCSCAASHIFPGKDL